MNNWISVKDRLPEVFEPVIVCRRNRQGGQVVEAGQKDIGDWWRVYGTRTKSVTHWMPLPDPPGEASRLSAGRMSNQNTSGKEHTSCQ